MKIIILIPLLLLVACEQDYSSYSRADAYTSCIRMRQPPKDCAEAAYRLYPDKDK